MTTIHGKRIAVTRPEHQSEEMVHYIQENGAIPLPVPLIEIKSLVANKEVQLAISEIEKFDVVAFTSVNAVEHFVSEVIKKGKFEPFQSKIFAAIGEKTKQALEEKKISVSIYPKDPKSSEDLVIEFQKKVKQRGLNILHPRAKEGRKIVEEGLSRKGDTFFGLTVYETVPIKKKSLELFEMCQRGEVDWLTFASGSAVDAFFKTNSNASQIIQKQRIQIAVLGEVTAEGLKKYKLSPQVLSPMTSFEKMVDEIKNSYL